MTNLLNALLKAKNWLKNEGLTAGKMEIPENLINLAKKVKTNAAIEDSESDSDLVIFNIIVFICGYNF
jgi:hypothetical protein